MPMIKGLGFKTCRRRGRGIHLAQSKSVSCSLKGLIMRFFGVLCLWKKVMMSSFRLGPSVVPGGVIWEVIPRVAAGEIAPFGPLVHCHSAFFAYILVRRRAL